MNKIFKQKHTVLLIVVLLLYSNSSFAEGQDGIAEIIGNVVNAGRGFMIFTNILVYTIIGGLLIKAIFFKNHKTENKNFKSFSISLLLSILLTIIFQDKFTFLIYNAL
jgi:hypothetical protein